MRPGVGERPRRPSAPGGSPTRLVGPRQPETFRLGPQIVRGAVLADISRPCTQGIGMGQDRVLSPAHDDGALRLGADPHLPHDDVALPRLDVREVQYEAFRLECLGKGGQVF